ncbi:hypothetical protein MSPP1_003041 [Malassezia sp. CBS 17886]|nr:hypothetical protein MSPP1_003041 [Malassezia sp. CBS 17886]
MTTPGAPRVFQPPDVGKAEPDDGPPTGRADATAARIPARSSYNVCPFCEKQFARSDFAMRHVMQAHSDHAPHACPHCGKRFSRPDSLRRHMGTCRKGPGAKNLRPLQTACVMCARQRKGCDRQQPCSSCIMRKTECTYRDDTRLVRQRDQRRERPACATAGVAPSTSTAPGTPAVTADVPDLRCVMGAAEHPAFAPPLNPQHPLMAQLAMPYALDVTDLVLGGSLPAAAPLASTSHACWSSVPAGGGAGLEGLVPCSGATPKGASMQALCSADAEVAWDAERCHFGAAAPAVMAEPLMCSPPYPVQTPTLATQPNALQNNPLRTPPLAPLTASPIPGGALPSALFHERDTATSPLAAGDYAREEGPLEIWPTPPRTEQLTRFLAAFSVRAARAGVTHDMLRRAGLAFFDRFISQYPVLHLATFDISTCPTYFAECVLAVGLLYVETSEAQAFSIALLHAAPGTMSSAYMSLDERGEETLFIAGILCLKFACYASDNVNLRTASRVLSGLLFTVTQKHPVTLAEMTWAPGCRRAADWGAWVKMEWTKRVLLFMVVEDTVQFDGRTFTRHRAWVELLRLPYATELWEAKSAVEWAHTMREHPKDPLCLREALSRLVKCEEEDDDSLVTPFSLWILAHLLLAYVCDMLQAR